uniref:Uncharacterized protein n=1 Tax=Rhizophora mucronata TaxID=61149 RepID=A0A2P2R3V7_RHIMU
MYICHNQFFSLKKLNIGKLKLHSV